MEQDKVIYTTLDLSDNVNVESIEINIDNVDMTVQEGTVEWIDHELSNINAKI